MYNLIEPLSLMRYPVRERVVTIEELKLIINNVGNQTKVHIATEPERALRLLDFARPLAASLQERDEVMQQELISDLIDIFTTIIES